MRVRPVLKLLQLCAAVLFAGTAIADDLVYPPGSRIGLVPPKGFVASAAFRGFVDVENKALIILFELPSSGFAEIEKSNSVDEAKKHGLQVNKREELALKNGGKAILFTGQAEADGLKANKWLLFASAPDFTAAVNVQIPDMAQSAHPEASIRAALATLATRPVPTEELLGLLPFKVENLASFKPAQVAENRTLVLADDPTEGTDTLKTSRIIIGAAAAPGIAADDRPNVSREALGGLTAFKDMKITFAEPVRLGGQNGFEIRADAKHVASGADVTIVQWMRFGTGGVLRIVGVAPKDKWAEAFPRFRTVRDSIAVR